MSISKAKKLTDLARVFLEPANATQRQYEALRAFFIDRLPGAEVAKRFGSSPGSFRVLVHQFRQDPRRAFFRTPAKGPHKTPKADPVRDHVVALRKQNLSISDISRALKKEPITLSPAAIAQILKDEGFARLPRRADEERPPGSRPITADIADARRLDLSPRQLHTKFGGLFLFLPTVAALPFDPILHEADLPGSEMVPAGHALRSLLALKPFGTARQSHVLSAVRDEGLALFAGLNVIPKRSFLAESSGRIAPSSDPKLMQGWFDAMGRLGLQRGPSFDLDFHTIPFHGDDALSEKPSVSQRSRRQKGMLAFLAQDAETRVFGYAKGELRTDQQNDEILRFVEFWKQRTGHWPEELIFDSQLTTYAHLSALNGMGIEFIPLRRRSKKRLAEVAQTPMSAWRRIELERTSRASKTPRVLDRRIRLRDSDGPLRQLTVAELGHEEPTLLLTNQWTRSAVQLIGRSAQRMLIENNIEDGIDFFHMDALSSAVALKVNCDLQLTLMASSLYRLLAVRIGNGYEVVKSRHLFRDLIDATADITIGAKEIVVKFQKRARNPLLVAAEIDKTDAVIPWLGGKRLRFVLR